MDPNFYGMLNKLLRDRMRDIQEQVMGGTVPADKVPEYLARYQEVRRLNEDITDAIEKWNKRNDGG